MADTPLDILARKHRAEQARLGAGSAAYMQRVTAGVDMADRQQVTRMVNTAAPTLLQRRAASIRAGRTYYDRARHLAYPGQRFDAPPPLDDDTAEERIRSSLWILARGRERGRLVTDDEDATRRDEAKRLKRRRTQLAGAAVRHTLDGGRQQVRHLALADDRAMGWVRITARDERVCYFCAMLASREDYKGTSFRASDARFRFGDNPLANAKVHDACRCSLRPVFYAEGRPEETQRAIDLWYELSEGDGREALKSFRRNYERRLREDIPVWQAA